MARGGPRPGGGRPRLTEAEKAASAEARKAKRKLAEKAKATAKKAPKTATKKAKSPRDGFSPKGVKSPDAPAGWPFGTEPPAPEPAPAPAVAPIDPDGEPLIPGGDPLDFLQAVINETRLKLPIRMQAAALAVGFKHAKPAPIGKKEAKDANARKVSKFAQAAPPKLVVNNR